MFSEDSQNSQVLHILPIDPPKWQAGGSAMTAELTFYVGECEGARR